MALSISFFDAACDESRRAILELLVPSMGQDSPDSYELRAGEFAQQLGVRSTALGWYAGGPVDKSRACRMVE
jgi:hypothetical protein